MSQYIVEKEFEHEGLKCVVLFGPLGHRTGYVGVPKGHPYFGKDYDERELSAVDVHGGLTYAGGGGNYPIKSDLHWFGFDCAHIGDGADFYLALTLFPENKEYIELMRAFCSNHGVVRSMEYVEKECRSLADQLNKAATQNK
ncbi:hypothetical protein KCG48_05075 [Proteiniclasticum sp. BAD-10]|uniref:Uncharacterized protein n=1 Tax=Proteiniclasticum sediminis TaxID=2804028 RepID=A0A941HQP8_9CLOT|nr:hypothetical protein [Proteiniclasticum sediminis]MBR0575713.1 hypothetical protein [Proteiniclasticum sediminis]